MGDDYLFDLFREMGLSRAAASAAEDLVSVLLIVSLGLLFARLGSRMARRSVESLVRRSSLPGMPPRSPGRAKALGGVAASAVRIVVWVVVALMVLGQFDVNLGPMLAGASIVGVALGFGAQSLVRDFLSGFFVLAEDQFRVGDTITIVDTTGEVEEVNLRTTRLRDSHGTVWFVPNGEIRKVGNSAKDWSRAVVDVVVAPDADLARARVAITEELDSFAADEAWAQRVLAPPDLLGVEALGADGSTVRVSVKTPPDQRMSVARELRARIGGRLVTEGIMPGKQAATPAAPAAKRSSADG